MTQLRIPLGDGCLVCDGFRLQVAGKPSLDFDGDLLWAIEQRIWRPLEVDLRVRGEDVLAEPLPLAQQTAFDPAQVLEWRSEAVSIRPLAEIDNVPAALAWWQAQFALARMPAEAWQVVSYAWGRLLRLDRRLAGLVPGGNEYLLLTDRHGCISLGHLSLDWRTLRFDAQQ